MTMTTEQLTGEDKLKIEKRKRNDGFAMFFVLFVILFIIYQFGVKGLGSELQKSTQNLATIGIALLGCLGVATFIFRFTFTKRAVNNGIKEIYIGPIKKKMNRSVLTMRPTTYKFYIDKVRFLVSKKEYYQYKDGDILRIESVSKTNDVLSLRVANREKR